MRKTIQFIIGSVLSILGAPSESMILREITEKILCNRIIDQCSIASSIRWIILIIGLVAILELILEWFGIIKLD